MSSGIKTSIDPLVYCATCEAVITESEINLRCVSGACNKFTCLSCIEKMIEAMFSQPTLNYPFKCGACLEVCDENIFHDVIVERGQYEKFIACVFPLYWAKDCLESNETIAQCPCCSYFEIHADELCVDNTFTCKYPPCGKRSCQICLHALDDDDDESRHHSHCRELRSYKKMIENAIELGSQQRCPYCNLTGIKDDGCTHMVCQRCKGIWCYMCGMKEYQCKVEENDEPSLSAHNRDWESNEGRCPMSLMSINEIDTRWPETDRDCLEYFHRYRTLYQLFDVLKFIGEERFIEINQRFGTIDASGYSIHDIQDFKNQIFINYKSDTAS